MKTLPTAFTLSVCCELCSLNENRSPHTYKKKKNLIANEERKNAGVVGVRRDPSWLAL